MSQIGPTLRAFALANLDRIVAVVAPILARVPGPTRTLIASIAAALGITATDDGAIVVLVVYAIGGAVDALVSWRARRIEADRVAKLRTIPAVLPGFILCALVAGCSHWSAGLTYARAEALATGAVEWTEGSGVATTGDLDCEASATGEVCYRSRCMPLRVSLETVDDGAGLWLCASVGPIVKCERVPQ